MARTRKSPACAGLFVRTVVIAARKLEAVGQGLEDVVRDLRLAGGQHDPGQLQAGVLQCPFVEALVRPPGRA